MSYSQLILPETPYGIWELSGNSPIDLTGRNNATYTGCVFGKKPIIYGLEASTVLDEDSSITISNIYKLFLTGSETKAASLEFFFNIPDSDEEEILLVTIGSFARCYIKSDRIYLEANGSVCNILAETWDKTNYVAIIYKQGSLTLCLNDTFKKSITFSEDFILPDSEAPDIIFGPAGNDMIVYLNEICIYSYSLSDSQISDRVEKSNFSGNSDRVATAISAEIINPKYQQDMEVFSDKLSTKQNFEKGTYNNIVIENDYLTLESISPVSVSSMNSSIDFNLNMNGISFGGESYIKLDNISSKFTGIDNVIFMSLLLDGLYTKQTILELGPGVDYSSLSLVKTDDNKFALIKKSTIGNEEIIIESSSLGSDFTSYFNVALIFNLNTIELLVNDISQGIESISQLLSPFTMYLGNSFSGLSPLTSKIKNFTIDKYIAGISTSISEILYQNSYIDEYSQSIETLSNPKIFPYGDIGLYTLSFQNTLNVSQKGIWSIQYPKIIDSVGGTITYNYGSKNSTVIVNNKEINTSSFIPNYNYANPETIKIDAILKTRDSFNELPVLDNIFVIAYQTTDIVSYGGKYTLTSLPDEDNNPYNNIQPYLLTDIPSNPLDRPKNMGCKFIRNLDYLNDINDDPAEAFLTGSDQLVTSGGRIVINSETLNQIKTFEFLFKLESLPIGSQEFTLFSVDATGGAQLSISTTGLVKTGTYDLYVDGVLTNTISNIDINEFYYIAVVFPTQVSNDIYLGINKNSQNMFNGSMSNIIINGSTPASMSSYVNYRYEAMKGRNTITLSDTDPISISDDSGTSKTYIVSSDGATFAMNELPKIRIVQDDWETNS